MNNNSREKRVVELTKGDIQGLMRSPDDLESAYMNWIDRSKSRSFLDQISDCKNLDEKVDWLEKKFCRDT